MGNSVLMNRRKIRLIESNAKCCHRKEFTCKRTLWQVFIRVYRLDIHIIQSVMLVFSTQLSELLPLEPGQCVVGGGGGGVDL
jgi:hypothetical protein